MLIEINWTPYIPTSILGLIGLLFAYAYETYKTNSKNRLKQVESADINDRPKVIERFLNDIGVEIDTKDLTPGQKYELLAQGLKSKLRLRLIIAVSCIVIAVIVAFVITSSSNSEISKNDKYSEHHADSTESSRSTRGDHVDSMLGAPYEKSSIKLISKIKSLGESQINDEYYLLVADESNYDSALNKYKQLKELAQLSVEVESIPDSIYLLSSDVNIGFGEDQVVLARNLTDINKYIVGLSLLANQGEPGKMKEQAELLKHKISKRIDNINHENTVLSADAMVTVNKYKSLLKRLAIYLEASKVHYYSSSDYRSTYGIEIPG